MQTAVCASRLKFPWKSAALAVLALGTAVWLYASAGPVQKHMSTQACSTCHLAGDAVTRENAMLLLASQEDLCSGCHPKAAKVSHPSGIRPTGALPAAYPLDWKGDLTCSTCHNVHGSTPGLMRGNARGRNFCLSCHDMRFFDKMADQGVSMITSGHLSSAVKLNLQDAEIDPYTLQCMGCHGAYADLRGVMIDSRQILRHAGNSMNHPIGHRYSDSFMKGRYKPEAIVAQRLVLPDGRLSCITCHRGYSKEHGKLRVSKRGSALCFECHDI